MEENIVCDKFLVFLRIESDKIFYDFDQYSFIKVLVLKVR